MERIAPEAWWLEGKPADTDAFNRGLTSNLLVVREGTRLWLVGAGPSPIAGHALRCMIEANTGQRITDVVLPWPRAELTLGASAFAGARLWAHKDVARVMQQRCATCTQRMRGRLGDAGSDLGDNPVRLPTNTVQGTSGTLGPFKWWKLERDRETPVLVLAPRGVPLITTHGLLWPRQVPDMRDSSVSAMVAATRKLQRIVADGPEDLLQTLGEQGSLRLASVVVQDHLTYWLQLERAVAQGLAAGDDGVTPSPLGLDADQAQRLQHDLNWQRAWRQAETRQAPHRTATKATRKPNNKTPHKPQKRPAPNSAKKLS
jgi:hypothetical protein